MNTYFDFGSIRPLHYFFGISGFLGIVFALVSQNEQSSFILHLTLWLLQTTGPIIILVYTHIALHQLSFFDKQNPWLKLFISGLLGAVLFSPFALFLDFLWGNDVFPDNAPAFINLLVNELGGVVPPVTISWVAINAPWLVGHKFINTKQSPKEPKTPIALSDNSTLGDNEHDQKQGIMSLVDNDAIGEIVYLKSELHYLMVVGSVGKQLVLYNLRDAIEDLPASLGTQAHRSFWVNYAHIDHVLKKGRQAKAIMSTSCEIPVSRAHVAAFKAYL